MRLSILLGLSTLLLACGGKTLEVDPGFDSGTVDDAATTDTAPDLAWCLGAGDCSLLPKTCCGSCSTPTVADMVAVRKGNESKYRDLVCGPTPPACPECAPYIADDSLQAWCIFGSGGGSGGGAPAGRCTAVDVRKEPVSACSTDTDCMLRHSSCCEPCDARRDDLVALSRSSIDAYRSKVCTGTETCSRCMTSYPSDALARCDTVTRHCVVEWVDTAAGG